MRYFFLLFFSLFTLGNALSQEVTVPLSTEKGIAPIYLFHFNITSSSLPQEYCDKLHAILKRDLILNGKCDILPTREGEQDLFSPSQNPYTLPFWKDHVAKHLLYIESEGMNLTCTIYGKSSSFNALTKKMVLTGDVSSDRRLIHSLADQIHQELFRREGVCRTSLLYAVCIPQKQGDHLIWKSEIWRSDYDGENAHPVTSENNYCITPLFLPDKIKSSHFLYVNYKLGQSKIFINSFTSALGTPYIPLRGNQLLPTVAKKGDKIAFISDASGNTDLFIQYIDPHYNLIGKPIQVFSTHRSTQASPAFHPSGSPIAFVSDKDGLPRIYLIETPSLTHPKPITPICLTAAHRESTCPNWSPDGEKLAYSAKVGQTRQLFIYDFKLRKETQLTEGEGHKENPSWSKNSETLVYNSVTPLSSDLYLLNIYHLQPFKIASGAGKKHYPSWEP